MPSTRSSNKVETVQFENPEPRAEVIIFQGNFSVFTIDDLAVTLKLANANIRFGVAMNESVPKLTRVTGNDEVLKKLAATNSLMLGAGHAGVVLFRDAYPVNVMNAVKMHPCICRVYAASSNPMNVLVGETSLGRSILGVVDGTASKAIETDVQKAERQTLVNKLGYGKS